MNVVGQIVKKGTIFGCLAYTFDDWVASPWFLTEDSMEPTLKHGQVVVTRSWVTTLSRGDIVIVKHPENPQERICKRVVGET